MKNKKFETNNIELIVSLEKILEKSAYIKKMINIIEDKNKINQFREFHKNIKKNLNKDDIQSNYVLKKTLEEDEDTYKRTMDYKNNPYDELDYEKILKNDSKNNNKLISEYQNKLINEINVKILEAICHKKGFSNYKKIFNFLISLLEES